MTGLAYSANGEYLYSSGAEGNLVLYSCNSDKQKYSVLRVLANTVARSERLAPDSLAVSPDSRFVAFIGPTEFTVSVVDGRTLNEVYLNSQCPPQCTVYVRLS